MMAEILSDACGTQRIENFWNFMWRQLASHYRNRFHELEVAGMLDR